VVSGAPFSEPEQCRALDAVADIVVVATPSQKELNPAPFVKELLPVFVT
jgi:hypothetical protein